jgi:hypothetical protein
VIVDARWALVNVDPDMILEPRLVAATTRQLRHEMAGLIIGVLLHLRDGERDQPMMRLPPGGLCVQRQSPASPSLLHLVCQARAGVFGSARIRRTWSLMPRRIV